MKNSKILKEKGVGIFTDTSNAFYCCSHEIIFSKVKPVGLSDAGINLFYSYFNGRSQALWLDGVASNKLGQFLQSKAAQNHNFKRFYKPDI